MRLWSIHPKYLDTQGLLALWREALLAQEVLKGHTIGYKNHPQLQRFKDHPDPKKAIQAYLMSIWEESHRRGYHFNKTKIGAPGRRIRKMRVTQGQVHFEFRWLCEKLKKRAPMQYTRIQPLKKISVNPFFKMTKGSIAGWEKTAL